MNKLFIFCLILMITAASCHKKTIPESAASYNKSETGEASYYADKFVGRSTASGETYQHTKFTAAHRTLPFGTIVKVTNLNNGKTVTVRINDRGPFARGRIIDLSKAAAKQIDMVNAGVAKVRIEYKR